MDKKKFDKKLYDKQYQIENKERIAKKQKAWYEDNWEKISNQQKIYYRLNKSKKLEYHKKWYESNKEKRLEKIKAYRQNNDQKVREKKKQYAKQNNAKITAKSAKRYAKKLQATPPWMTKKDFADIEEWYQIAKELQWLSEEPLHVDHIIPLQGKDVCGLHIAANLQILPASMNIRKGNRVC